MALSQWTFEPLEKFDGKQLVAGCKCRLLLLLFFKNSFGFGTLNLFQNFKVAQDRTMIFLTVIWLSVIYITKNKIVEGY